jgi:hypothetical protein
MRHWLSRSTKLRALVVGALLLLPAAAQSQTIHGVVVEDSTRVPIAGAVVELVGVDTAVVASAQSDSVGAFVLRPGRSGKLVVRLSHPSYVAADSITLEIDKDEMIAVELRMGRAALPLEPVIVTTRRDARVAGFYERQRRAGFGQFLTREEIERRPGAQATDLLQEMRGIEIVPVRGGAIKLITMRGGAGRCQPTIYVDGVRVRQFAESGMDAFLTANTLEGVEVYTSPAGTPAELWPEGSCGVVAFWTRWLPDGGRKWSWLKLVAGLAGFAVLVLLVR